MRNLRLILLLTGLLPFAAVQAAPASLPETGQITCSDTSGATIDCTNTGQDGEYRAGVAWPTPRFVVGTDGTADCVTDNLTGLMWMRAPDGVGAANWTTALTTANNLTLCGFSDWRLPNVNELESLLNSGSENHATFLNTQGFSGVQSSYYWASTSDARAGQGNTRSAWIIGLANGILHLTNSKSESYSFWPVRGGQ